MALMAAFIANAQQRNTLALMDFVKIKDGKKAEALYYYTHNWKVYRDSLMRQGHILGYSIREALPDSLNNFDLILITEYKDSAQYAAAEPRFNELIKKLRPNGPLLLNDLKPSAFRENLYYRLTRIIAAPILHRQRGNH
jgi:hypothetical protein